MSWVQRVPYLAGSILCGAGVLSILQYPGDKFIFSCFCIVIFTIGYSAIKSNQYSHFFLGITWFLGFWAKYFFHCLTGDGYGEPVGAFNNSVASWDAVFYLIAIGGSGYLAGRLLILPATNALTERAMCQTINVPRGWPKYRNLIWVGAAVALALVLIANANLGILVRGHVAKVILPWPLGGLFAWITDIGFALILSLFLAWDRESGKGVERGFLALCIEGALFSLSTQSRGVFFFHTVPAIVTEIPIFVKTRALKSFATLFVIWFLIGSAVPTISTFIRLFGSDAVPTTIQKTQERQSRTAPTPEVLWNQFVTMARLLVVDRWTGLEGAMASAAYSEKSFGLFKEAALQRRTYGMVDVYTGKISQSGFTEERAKIYHYATPSGPIAFLYFSGSYWFVFWGMALVAVLMSLTELAWRWLAREPLLIAMSGLYLAFIVMQISGGIVQSATGLLAVTGFFFAIWCSWRLVRRPFRKPATRLAHIHDADI
jgi:hypothetical protein